MRNPHKATDAAIDSVLAFISVFLWALAFFLACGLFL